jgi:hypothetical protein
MSDESSAPVSEEVTETVEEGAELEAEAEGEPELEAKAEPASTRRKYTPKVNGRQLEVELDPNNEEEVLKYIQKAMAADEKFQEAASLRKNVEMLVSQLKSNPRDILSHPELGIDLKKFAQDILNEEIEEMKKTPEQKELEKLRKELEGKTKREQQLEEEKRQAEMSRLQEQAFKQFDDELTDALSSTNLPKSPYVVKRIADTLIEAVNMGYEDATVKDIMPIVEKQIQGELQKMFEVMPEEVMEQLIGQQNLSRLRKSRISKMKQQPVTTAKQIKDTGKSAKSQENDKKEDKVKFSDLFGNF